jgi:hypothetical protein
MKNGLVSILAGAAVIVFAPAAFASEPTEVERVQAALDAWLAARAPVEKVTGIAAYPKIGWVPGARTPPVSMTGHATRTRKPVSAEVSNPAASPPLRDLPVTIFP